jgi:hypothetical protein
MNVVSSNPKPIASFTPARQAPSSPPAATAPNDSVTLSVPAPHFKLSGSIPASESRFQAHSDPDHVVAPIKVAIPGGKFVAQYAPTVVGKLKPEFDPADDCNGNFMSSKFQANNNCYNYACDVATNSFAQPGRKHGILLGDGFSGDDVVHAAEKDGLLEVSEKPMSEAQMAEAKKSLPPGHFVALVISPSDPAIQWPGDYHWARHDDDGTWSQKDGGDQVTNFDFAGKKITDPAAANWTVNQGPISSTDPDDAIASYDFKSIMYVPDGKIDII